MKIKEKYGEFTKGELFNISKGNGCTLMKNVDDGELIEVHAAVLMTDEVTDSTTGETREKELLHLKTDAAVYTTESPTVIKTFEEAIRFMDTYQLTFRLMRGKSKSGRAFMDLELVDSFEVLD